MIFITQLIYINEGQEKVFEEFESNVIPAISKHQRVKSLSRRWSQIE